MRTILIASAALLLSSSAFAAGDIMAGTYGNSIVGKTGPIESRTHYRADHTFDSSYSSPMGSMDAKGTWALNAQGQLCRTFETAPPGLPNPLCLAWAEHKVGDTWTVTTANGSTQLSLVKGP